MQVEGKLCDEIKPSASVAKELQKKVTQAEAGKRENLSLIILSPLAMSRCFLSNCFFFVLFLFCCFFFAACKFNSVSYWSLTLSLM